MGEFVHVDSVEALTDFRVRLCKAAEQIGLGLEEADVEIQRTMNWLKQEQHTYWKAEVRTRSERAAHAALELKRKQQEKTPSGEKYSCIDEKKALAVAKGRLEEAEQKLANVRRWARRIEEEAFAYRGAVRGLGQLVASGLPESLAQLDAMIVSLEAYLLLRPPSESDAPPAAEPQRPPPDSGDTG